MPQSWDMGQIIWLPLRRKACWGFLHEKNPTASAGFEPANSGTRGQHANHQTTEAVCLELLLVKSRILCFKPQYSFLIACYS
jgi:hypothetical protein